MKKRTSTIIVVILGGIGLCVAIPLGVNVYRDSTDPLKQEAREHGITNYYEKDGLLRDRIELDPAFRRIEAEVDAAANMELEARGLNKMGMGRFSIHEQFKKKILKEGYGIEWRSVVEMNPFVAID
ncbi:MAG: hypothetical protein ABIS50_19115 [Luteolibacter sp.]|uniref:hypothetical protein n=1 Tax=Luteolibacter sp. TaxID=1962973 RepID=UPI0032667587